MGKYEIQVNGEKVWDSGDLDEAHVIDISVMTPRGEMSRIGIPPGEAVLNLEIHPRSLELRPLDLMDTMKARGNDGVVDALVDTFGGQRDKDIESPEPEEPTPSIEEHLRSQGMNLDGSPIAPEDREEPVQDEEFSFSGGQNEGGGLS